MLHPNLHKTNKQTKKNVSNDQYKCRGLGWKNAPSRKIFATPHANKKYALLSRTPVLPVPHPTQPHTRNKSRCPEHRRRRRRRRLHLVVVVVVVLLLCVQNVPQITQNLIRFQPTTKNTRTHNPPPPPSILPTNQSTKSMSSDFDDDIDFDPDDLTILLHFFRKLWDRLQNLHPADEPTTCLWER